jgi:lipopolysaccharide transport system permease protein
MSGRSTFPVQIRDLVVGFAVRDLKSQYARSLLGFTWVLLHPLLLAAVFFVVFSRIIPLEIPNYWAFLFTGILAYNWFQTSLQRASRAIIGNPELILYPGFPRFVLPLVPVLTSAVGLVVALPVLAIIVIAESGELQATAIMAPIVLLVQGLFIAGMAYGVAIANTYFRDVEQILGVVLRLLFYLTPIFYNRRRLPEEIAFIYDFNPLAVTIESLRAVVLLGEYPDWSGLLWVTVVSLVLLGVFGAGFKRLSPGFAERI